MSLNVRRGKSYTEIDYGFNQKTLDISAMSLHRVLRTAWDMDALNEWGSVVALTYIAAQRVFPDYNEMADAKALLESVSRSFGYHYGVKKKVRVNTISQSPTRTTAGSGVKGFDGFVTYAEKMSPLGNASGDDCANYCVTLFSDMTKMVTMQNLFHDGGFSFTGVTNAVIDQMEKSVCDLSIWMILILLLNVTIWLIYGITGKDKAMILANTIIMVLSLLMLYFKLTF
jgi:enoyl-[acyl-carrier protein] reductase I